MYLIKTIPFLPEQAFWEWKSQRRGAWVVERVESLPD